MPSTLSDFLLQATDATDIDHPTLGVDARLRGGYPRLTEQGNTPSDATIARRAAAGIPANNLPSYDTDDCTVEPLPTEEHVNVKRALQFKPHTGVNFTTGGYFTTYLKENFESRVLDGSAIFQVVDQTFEKEPHDATKWRPGLTYMRLGKPEPKLLSNGQPLDREDDRLMDQKYQTGIGMFSDGSMNVWTRDNITLKSNKVINLLSDEKIEETYGENSVFNYEYEDKDLEDLRKGHKSPADVNRKIVNVVMLRDTPLGWYRQTFDRGRNIEYSTSNKGEFAIGASHGMSIGAKFDHDISAGLETSFTGKVEVSAGFKVEIASEGAKFTHPFGSWTHEAEAELTGFSKVEVGIAGLNHLPLLSKMKLFYIALEVAVVAQQAAFMAYNATLAGQADRTIDPTSPKGDDSYGLKSALDEGMKIYEAALSLSAITCAAGIVLGAVQAVLQKAPSDPTAPRIVMKRNGIRLQCGPSSITLTNTGIKIAGPMIESNGSQVTTQAMVVNHYAGAMGLDDVVLGNLWD